MFLRQQSTTTYPVQFFLTQSTDHVSPATGKTVTITASKNGAAFGAVSGAVTELANGWYSWAGNATDRNTVGELAVRATATGTDDLPMKFVIVPWDPFDTVRLGLTALPNAAAAASGGLFVRGTGAGAINQDSNGRIDVNVISVGGSTAVPGTVDANVVQVSGDTTAADNWEAALDGTGYSFSNCVVPTVTLVNGLATDTVNAAALAADAVTEIQTGLSGLDAAGIRAAVGLSSANLDTQLTTIDDFLDTEIADIRSRLPAALVSGRMDSSVGAMAANVITTASIADLAYTEAKFTVPAEAAGRPTGLFGMIRRIFEWRENKRTRNRTTGVVTLRNAADSGTLVTATQSTSGVTDTQTGAS